MKTTTFVAALAPLLLLSPPALAETIPVVENLWNLEKQEDTDGDHRITVHDTITPFEILGESGATVRTVTNVYPLSAIAGAQTRRGAQNQFRRTGRVEAR